MSISGFKRTLIALIPLGVLIACALCGMTQATILSVPTLVYAPFCFFCILSPLMSILIGAIGWKIRRKKQ